jgi:hypothetical protein
MTQAFNHFAGHKSIFFERPIDFFGSFALYIFSHSLRLRELSLSLFYFNVLFWHQRRKWWKRKKNVKLFTYSTMYFDFTFFVFFLLLLLPILLILLLFPIPVVRNHAIRQIISDLNITYCTILLYISFILSLSTTFYPFASQKF